MITRGTRSPSARRRRAARALPLTVSLLAAGALAAGCSSSGSSGASGSASASSSAKGGSTSTASLSSVTLHIGDQAGSGAQSLLTAAGLINKLPFKVDWSDFTSGPPMLQAAGSGSVDIGAVGDSPPVFAAAGGEKIAVVAATVANPDGTALLVPKGSSVHSVTQLKGKTIAVAEGSSSNYHLLTVLKRAGLTVKDVKIDNLQPAQALAAFASGHIDAWDIWSPFIEQAEVQHGARVLINGAPVGKTFSFEVASRTALADPAKTAAIKAYLKLINQAHVWANTHQAAWAATWAQATGLPSAIMTKAAADSTAPIAPISPAAIRSEQAIANAYSAAGLIPGHVNFANFAVSTFNSSDGAGS
jgi:sulfonate transport system substrate-binding protein